MVQFSPEEKAEVSFLYGGVHYPRWLRSGEYPIASLDWEGRYRW